MREPNLFLVFVSPLNRGEVPYMVTGSVASIAYGEPRLVRGIDLVVQLEVGGVAGFIALYPVEDFRCPDEAEVRAAVSGKTGGCFRVVHRASGFPADFYAASHDAFDRWAMERRQAAEMGADRIWLAPPEYVIVRALQRCKDGGGAEHARDIERMLEISGEIIDRGEVEAKVAELGLSEVWRAFSR